MNKQDSVKCDNTVNIINRNEIISCENKANYFCINAQGQDLRQNLCFFCYYGKDAFAEVKEYREKEKKRDKLLIMQTFSIVGLITLLILFSIKILWDCK